MKAGVRSGSATQRSKEFCVYATVVSKVHKNMSRAHVRFKSGAQLTRFEAGRPASKQVKGCES